MNAENFLDSNVFVYQLDHTDPRKTEIADALIRAGLRDGRTCISFQVIQECLNVALTRGRAPLTEAQALLYMQAILLRFPIVEASIPMYERSLDIRARYRFSLYDSLIVAAALQVGCTRLYTEDLQHGQRIHQLTIQDPFLA